MGVEVAGPAESLEGRQTFRRSAEARRTNALAKAWNFGNRQELLQPGTKLDVLFQVEDDPYSRKRGYASWCLSLKDIRPA